ncbi:MAG: caspase family protein [Alphaproteobacteria bacterium]|nr:caspase family protein [Alphaproteobacteria bacterium]
MNRLAGIVLAAALGALLAAAPAFASKKVALVIGNSNYADAPLRNPANDAREMAKSLRARGFDVLLKENVTKAQFSDAVADFGEKLAEGDTALFFYAGHGMQVQGRNYLVPVDARITSEQRVRLETLDVEAVLDQMAAAKARVSMVILDACRNNPFERRFRSTGGGLAQINAPEGTLIAYATAPGKVAADGEGSNGLYTQALLRALNEPGLKVEEVFKQVRIDVARASGGAQVPWEASSLTGDFFFQPPQAGAAPAAPVDRETLFWDSIRTSNNPAEMRAYLDAYPAGTFASIARERMAALSAANDSAPRGQVAAVPRIARSITTTLMANVDAGVVILTAGTSHITIENNVVRLTLSNHQSNSITGVFRCLGVGKVDADLRVPPLALDCESYFGRETHSVTGHLEESNGRFTAHITFNSIRGRTTEVVYK